MKIHNPRILIYGANGYSAGLILQEFLKRGIKPVLAGRNREKVSQLSNKFGLEYRIFDLSESKEIQRNLDGINTVLNCAGPFSSTAAALMDACLKSGTNYLDITGEIDVFQAAWNREQAAKTSGIVILPGAGFDVIPTDCMAKRLKEELPDAQSLMLGFATKNGRISKGTLKSTLLNLSQESLIRKGEVIKIRAGSLVKKIDFGEFSSGTTAIPWADVLNAFYSTKIDDIQVYMAMPNIVISFYKTAAGLIKLSMSVKPVKKIIDKMIDIILTGPDEKQRITSSTYIWGKVENANGNFVERVSEFPDGYTLTALAATECALRIANAAVEPGTWTPSLAFGSSFSDIFKIREIK
ncbi:MAG: saccharopine dehydrogenase family protein [Bacillota bacterium]